ncbi:MAG: DUF5110 domain-containing protein [Balneolaceae bacterium]|nr:MAG: DUF5110 domain-containing protein [Balneolaceae bacterium]
MRTFYIIVLLVCFALLSCESYPEADFYEVNGIVSIDARSIPDQNNWETRPYYTSVSKVSYEDSLSFAGRLTFPFFIRRPGAYSIWTLTKQLSDQSEENNLTFRVLDNQQFLLDDFRLQLNEIHALEWLNRDSRSGEEISVFFPKPGYYSIIFESGGRGGYVIDKLYLSLNGDRKPEGFAMPETNNFRVDPVLSKRDQRVVIPPAWSFGVIAGTSGSGEDAGKVMDQFKSVEIFPDALTQTAGDHTIISEHGIQPGIILFDEHNRYVDQQNGFSDEYSNPLQNLSASRYHFVKLWPGAGFSVIKDTFELLLEKGLPEHRRGFVMSGLENSYIPEVKEYPAIWSSLADVDLLRLRDNENYIYGLKETISMVANPVKSTYEIPFLLLNIGGYYRDISQMDEEEIVRWVQFLAFYTMMYLHSGDEDISEVISSLPEESLNYIAKLLEHRGQLFPFIYSLAHLVRPTGVKPVRGSAEYPGQFWLGNAFLVAPVYQKGAIEREVFLPEGIWYHYWDGTQYRGGETITVDAPLYQVPVFVKAGSIIPYRQRADTITAGSNDVMKVDVYGGDRGLFRLYEDDGITTHYQLGEFSTTAFRYFEHDDYATFTIGRMVREYRGQPARKELLLAFKFVDEPVSIIANEENLERGDGAGQWWYDQGKSTLLINWVQPNHQKTDFVINFSKGDYDM